VRLGKERLRPACTSGPLGAPLQLQRRSEWTGAFLHPLAIGTILMTAFPLDPLVPLAMQPRADAPATLARAAIQARDILPLSAYERIRSRYFRLMTELRKHRRARLAPHVGILFENRETVLFQIHEVLRLEGHTPAHVQRELAQYACLVPRPGELRATVMIDGGTHDEGRALAAALRRPGAVTLTIAGIRCGSASASPHGDADDPIQYLRFAPGLGIASELRRRSAALELAVHVDGRRLTTFVHRGLRAQLRDDLGPSPARSLLHTLAACPWMLTPAEIPSWLF
jgi:hypothetical protein